VSPKLNRLGGAPTITREVSDPFSRINNLPLAVSGKTDNPLKNQGGSDSARIQRRNITGIRPLKNRPLEGGEEREEAKLL